MNVVYESYMKSKDWYIKRAAIYQRAGGKCERCGSTFKVEVHHVSYENLGNEKNDELMLLCRNCHMLEHLWGIGKNGRKKKDVMSID